MIMRAYDQINLKKRQVILKVTVLAKGKEGHRIGCMRPPEKKTITESMAPGSQTGLKEGLVEHRPSSGHIRNGSREFAEPSGPFSTSLTPSLGPSSNYPLCG
jgi:hypothetical protein